MSKARLLIGGLREHTLAMEEDVDLVLLGVSLELVEGDDLGVGHSVERGDEERGRETRTWREGRYSANWTGPLLKVSSDSAATTIPNSDFPRGKHGLRTVDRFRFTFAQVHDSQIKCPLQMAKLGFTLGATSRLCDSKLQALGSAKPPTNVRRR